jgi:hypothetical protein
VNLKQLAVSIASFAPTLATMLGGPLAGTAVSALAGALGLKQGAGADDVTQVMQAGTLTPDQLASIRAADQKHAEIIEQQKIDLAKLNADHEEAFAKIDADDRASARAREIALRDNTPKILAYLVTAGFFGMLYLLYRGKPADGGEVLLAMIGSLGTGWGLVMAYYFGSSKGSAMKDITIANISKK